MTNKIDGLSTATKIAYAALSICLACIFIKSHRTALAVAQPLPNSMAYATGLTGWLQDERRLLILTFALAATPLVIIYGVLLFPSFGPRRPGLSSPFALAPSLGGPF